MGTVTAELQQNSQHKLPYQHSVTSTCIDWLSKV